MLGLKMIFLRLIKLVNVRPVSPILVRICIILLEMMKY